MTNTFQSPATVQTMSYTAIKTARGVHYLKCSFFHMVYYMHLKMVMSRKTTQSTDPGCRNQTHALQQSHKNTLPVLIIQTSLLEQNKLSGFLPGILWSDLKGKESVLHPVILCQGRYAAAIATVCVYCELRKKGGLAANTITLTTEWFFILWKGQQQYLLDLFQTNFLGTCYVRTDILGIGYISFKNKQQNQQTKMGTGTSELQVLINSDFSTDSII